MVRYLLLMILLLNPLAARENPFEPVSDTKDPAVIKKREVKHFKHDKVDPPEGARIIKDVVVEYQNLDGSISKQKLKIDKRVDWKNPINITQQKVKPQPYKKEEIKATKFLSTIVEPYKIFIETDDEYIRDFIIIKPFRVVVDFKRSVRFKSKRYEPKVTPFTTIAVGNHRDYYRVVVTMDSRYTYKTSVYDNGVLVELKR
jgi:hypothetical protein